MSSVVFVLIVIAAILWFGQRSLMYFPDTDVPSPRVVGLPRAQVVDFETEDGLRLGAWFVPAVAPANGYTVLVFNGNAGHRSHRAPLADALSQAGMSVLLMDYRGYGDNPGMPHEAGLHRDTRGALAYLRSRDDVDARRIVYFGESLGTGVAVRLAVDDPPSAVILRSPFTSFTAVAGHHYPGVPARWLLRDRYNSAAIIAQLRSPVLVIAGDEDRIVPFEDSQTLFEHVTSRKRFVTIPGADHNDEALGHGPDVIRSVVDWLGGR